MIWFYILAALPVALQVILLIHAIRNGKSTLWIYLLIFLPLAGSIVYIVIEVLPGLRLGHHAVRAGERIAGVVDPSRSIRKLEKALEDTDTHDNRMQLAEACLLSGDFKRAEALSRASLTGPFTDDQPALILLAASLTCQKRFDEALLLWDKTVNLHGFPSRDRDIILYSESAEGAGFPDKAEQILVKGISSGSPFQTLNALAGFLDRHGKSAEAMETRRTILRKGEKLTRRRKREEQRWIRMAREKLKDV